MQGTLQRSWRKVHPAPLNNSRAVSTNVHTCTFTHTKITMASLLFRVKAERQPPPRIQEPAAEQEYTHTVILLHGGGSDGPQFWRAIRRMRPSLFAHFPTFRWVFPSATLLWSASHEVERSQWFDASPNDSSQHLQVIPGLDRSVQYLVGLMEEEVHERLGGRWERLVLGGLSQGQATALHALLCCKHRLGAFFGASGWLPLAHELQQMDLHTASAYLRKELLSKDQVKEEGAEDDQVGGTPVFLGHGTHDRKVPLMLAIRARDVLSRSMKMEVTWRQYVDAKLDGHWIKEPEGLEDIAEFLQAKLNIDVFQTSLGKAAREGVEAKSSRQSAEAQNVVCDMAEHERASSRAQRDEHKIKMLS